MRRLMVAGGVALSLVLAGVPAMATRGGAPRGDLAAPRGNYLCDYQANGTPELCDDEGPERIATESVDSGKRSSSLRFTEGDYLRFDNYWHDPANKRTLVAANATYKFSYKGVIAGGTPRINVFLADATGAETGEYLFLDPNHCTSSPNAKGWSTADFNRTGSACTIYDNDGNAYTGDDATISASATSAYQKAVAAQSGRYVYFSYVIQDAGIGGDATLLDRITFGGNVLTDF